MWTVIIFGLIFIAYGIYYSIKDRELYIGLTLLLGFVGALTGVLVGSIFGLISCLLPSVEYISEPTYIYGMTDSRELKESFCLGIGGIDSELQYYYVVETGDGFTKIVSSPANKTEIKESDEDPYMYTVQSKPKYKWLENFMFLEDIASTKTTKLVVPKDTIKIQYNVDLK